MDELSRKLESHLAEQRAPRKKKKAKLESKDVDEELKVVKRKPYRHVPTAAAAAFVKTATPNNMPLGDIGFFEHVSTGHAVHPLAQQPLRAQPENKPPAALGASVVPSTKSLAQAMAEVQKVVDRKQLTHRHGIEKMAEHDQGRNISAPRRSFGADTVDLTIEQPETQPLNGTDLGWEGDLLQYDLRCRILAYMAEPGSHEATVLKHTANDRPDWAQQDNTSTEQSRRTGGINPLFKRPEFQKPEIKKQEDTRKKKDSKARDRSVAPMLAASDLKAKMAELLERLNHTHMTAPPVTESTPTTEATLQVKPIQRPKLEARDSRVSRDRCGDLAELAEFIRTTGPPGVLPTVAPSRRTFIRTLPSETRSFGGQISTEQRSSQTLTEISDSQSKNMTPTSSDTTPPSEPYILSHKATPRTFQSRPRLQARDSRPLTERTEELADFLRATGPSTSNSFTTVASPLNRLPTPRERRLRRMRSPIPIPELTL